MRLDHPQRDETSLRGMGGRQEGKVRECQGDGRRWWILFCTLIYCRRYFLVGASWRLPHHRTRQWWPLDILFRIIARLAGPFYFGLDRTTPLRSAFFPRQLFVEPQRLRAKTVRSIRFELGGCPLAADLPSPATGQKDSTMPAICRTRPLQLVFVLIVREI